MEDAVRENRFVDAGYYNWVLSMQYLEQCSGDPEFNAKFLDLSNKANCYYAFDVIHKYLVMIIILLNHCCQIHSSFWSNYSFYLILE